MWLNTDLSIPVLRFFFPTGSAIIISAVVLPIATLELCYGYWFWGYWIKRRISELEKIREVRKRLCQEGILDRWVLDRILRIYHQTLNPKNKVHHFINRWGISFVWFVAVFLPPGTAARSGCAAVSGLFRQKKNFLHLLFANAVHVLLVVQIWEKILVR